MISKKDIGQYIPLYQNEKDISVQAFADMIGASKSAVYNWISGKSKPMTVFYNKLLQLLEPYYNEYNQDNQN